MDTSRYKETNRCLFNSLNDTQTLIKSSLNLFIKLQVINDSK